jgi:hypothetical protein
LWRTRHSNELYELFSDPDIVKTIKTGRLLWTDHVIRMLDNDPIKKLALRKPDGCRRVWRPKLRWMDGIEDALRMPNVRRLRQRALDRREWKMSWKSVGPKLGCRAISSSKVYMELCLKMMRVKQ